MEKIVYDKESLVTEKRMVLKVTIERTLLNTQLLGEDLR